MQNYLGINFKCSKSIYNDIFGNILKYNCSVK